MSGAEVHPGGPATEGAVPGTEVHSAGPATEGAMPGGPSGPSGPDRPSGSGGPGGPGGPGGGRGAADGDDAPGVGAAIGGARAAFRRMLDAHLALLRAELSVAGRELGLIIGLAVAALTIALLTFVLIYVGTWLFLGEWLFGSMGWGILHGTLLAGALISGIAIDLAGGWMGAYRRGFVIGVVTTVLLSLLFASNLLRTGAVETAEALESTIPLHPNLLPTLVGLVVGAIVVGLIGLFAARDTQWRSQALIAGLIIGALFGAILGSAIFDDPGAVAIGMTVGLLVWIVAAWALAARHGFDPERRYARLVPRESMAAFETTREFLARQWERQKGRALGR